MLSIATRSADPLVAQYGRMATSAKRAGDWGTAITYLQRLRDEFDVHNTRLPLFLMRAGRNVEAAAEFARLVSTARARTVLDHFGRPWPDRKQRFFEACEMAEIYSAMRVAFKRAGDVAGADLYARYAEDWSDVRDDLGDEIDAERRGLIP